MPVELRKRKAPAPAPEPPAKKTAKGGKAVPKAKDAVKKAADKDDAAKSEDKAAAAPAPAKTQAKAGVPAVGDVIALDTFGGEVETNDGEKTTLKKLVDESKAGVVLFTYPKASTGGCTKQACLFRDSHEELTAAGYLIFGLSTDSPRANTTFKTNQKLQYPLLCDPKQTLIAAIGMKRAGSKTAQRGVFMVDKEGKVLAAEAGSPAGTVDVVKQIVAEAAGEGATAGDEAKAAAPESGANGEEKAAADGDGGGGEENGEKSEEQKSEETGADAPNGDAGKGDEDKEDADKTEEE